MTIKIIDAAFETTTTTGTGPITLAGAQPGHQSFAGAGNGSYVAYQINDGDANGLITQREVGIGIVNVGTPNTLTRSRVLYSTNSNSAVNFGTGTKNVLGSIAAGILATRDENLNFIEGFGTGGGTANAHTVTAPTTPLAYSDGMEIIYFATVANNGAMTINYNGLGAKAAKISGADIPTGLVQVGSLVRGIYRVSTGFIELTSPAKTVPAMTKQYLLTGTAATYTTPAGCRKLVVKMVGGGGGGGARNTNNGGAGGDTSFNSIVAKGGGPGVNGVSINGGTEPSTGGTGGAGTADLRIAGNPGSTNSSAGGTGGNSPFGGAAAGGVTTGRTAAPNSGSGGAGGSSNSSGVIAGGGGGAGEYAELVISAPAATYSYTVGAGGNGAAAGSVAGGNGGSGLIVVEEYY